MSSDLLDKLNAMGKTLYDEKKENERRQMERAKKEIYEAVEDFQKQQEIIDMMSIALEVMQKVNTLKNYGIDVYAGERRVSMTLTGHWKKGSVGGCYEGEDEDSDVLKVVYSYREEDYLNGKRSFAVERTRRGRVEYVNQSDVVEAIFKILIEKHGSKEPLKIERIPEEMFGVKVPSSIEDEDERLSLQTSTWGEEPVMKM